MNWVLRLQQAAGNQAVNSLLRGGAGKPLDPQTRRKMEGKFGESFGNVQVHTGGEAAQSAEVLGANAWTSGSNIVFAEGLYAPETGSGRKLLAHELAHVVQQRRGGTAPPTFDTQSSAEQDASSAAAQAMSASTASVAVNAASGVGVARDEAELPWWKKKLNPIYQRALEVLPPEASQKLKQANELARQYVGQSGSNNEELNKVVETAQPVLAPVAAALGVKDEAGPSPDQQKLAARQEAAQSKVAPNGVRTDYAPADNAYSGTELAYTADVSGKGVTSPGVFKSKHYWLAPQLQAGTDKVVYYLAYNPETKRNEFVVGPENIQSFRDNEELYWYNAAAAYPLRGEPAEYKALSGRVAARALAGDAAGAFKAWKESWSTAAKDPNFWVEATLATAGGLAGAEARSATTLRGAATTAVDESAGLLPEAESAAKVPVTTEPPAGPSIADPTPVPVAPAAETLDPVAVKPATVVTESEATAATKPAQLTDVASDTVKPPATPAAADTAATPPALDAAGPTPPTAPAGGATLAQPKTVFWRKAELSAVSKVSAETGGAAVDLNSIGKSNFAGVDVVSEGELTTVKAYDGPSAQSRYINDLQEISGGRGPTGGGSKVSKTVKDIGRLQKSLAKQGKSLPLPAEYAADPAAYVEQNTVLRVPDDHVVELRDAIVKDLTNPANPYGYQNYGLDKPLSLQEAADFAARRVKGVGTTTKVLNE